jgi:LmbE family N-acetylglucosaminyl deacetylase
MLRITRLANRIWIAAAAAGVLLATAIPAIAQGGGGISADPYNANNRAPDPRFKADILVVVAHPDDETLVTAYLAREIFDHHKSVAVVYGTRGDGGNNDVGPEQALAMGQIREIEARGALGTLGISNVWFLTGRDTPSQNVLNSLERWGHGSTLDQLVRIVRITRPSVILTFLPDFTTGENHADHQAAGVLATEAFDLAGDPTTFPEQVSPVTNPDGNMNMTEGLRTWQPEKIYYFHNPTYDIFSGRGPQYSSDEISSSRHLKYGVLAAEAFSQHRTQGGDRVRHAIDDGTLEHSNDERAQLVTQPVKLIFGRSLVPCATGDDVFTGIQQEGISFQRASISSATQGSVPRLEIGDPWNYYKNFWHAHGLDHLATIVPLEITVKVGGVLAIPLIIDNPSNKPIDVNLFVKAPDGWQLKPVGPVAVGQHSRYILRVLASAPASKVDGWQDFTISAQSGDQDLGTLRVRSELSTGWVAPQY